MTLNHIAITIGSGLGRLRRTLSLRNRVEPKPVDNTKAPFIDRFAQQMAEAKEKIEDKLDGAPGQAIAKGVLILAGILSILLTLFTPGVGFFIRGLIGLGNIAFWILAMDLVYNLYDLLKLGRKLHWAPRAVLEGAWVGMMQFLAVCFILQALIVFWPLTLLGVLLAFASWATRRFGAAPSAAAAAA